MGYLRRARRRGGRQLSTTRRPPSDDDWIERLFADGSGIWDLFVVVFYLPVIMGAMLWLHSIGGEWLLWDRLLGEQPARDAGGGLVMGALLLAASRVGERTGPGARAAAVMAHYLGRVTWPGVVAMASAAAVGEELLFRGVLQPVAGLAVASLLFAAVHVPFREEMWPWTVQALLHGVLFGVAYELSGALVVPIVAHSLFNASQLVRWKVQSEGAS